jgi:hypothetical protein
MTMIRVDPSGEAGGRSRVEVHDRDGSRSEHEVAVSDADWERFGGSFETREDLVEASFRFLLEREPKESILRAFVLRDIARYFPEYGDTFTRREPTRGWLPPAGNAR